MTSYVLFNENSNWGCGLKKYCFEKTSGISRFDTLPLEIPAKTNIHAWKFRRIVCYTPSKFQGQKPRPLEIPQIFS